MTLLNRGTEFRTITRHRRCTQCLGSLEGKDWLLAVAPPAPTIAPSPTKFRRFIFRGTAL